MEKVCWRDSTLFAILPTSQGKYAEGQPLYERSQAMRAKALSPEHQDVAGDLNNQAELLTEQMGIECKWRRRSTFSRVGVGSFLMHTLTYLTTIKCVLHTAWRRSASFITTLSLRSPQTRASTLKLSRSWRYHRPSKRKSWVRSTLMWPVLSAIALC